MMVGTRWFTDPRKPKKNRNQKTKKYGLLLRLEAGTLLLINLRYARRHSGRHEGGGPVEDPTPSWRYGGMEECLGECLP